MNKTKFSAFVLRLVCVLAIAAMALCTFGCETKTEVESPKTDGVTNAGDADDVGGNGTEATEVKEVGEGATTFDFEVVDIDGNVAKFKVSTDKKTVGEALLDAGLIEGEDGQYGLYVKKVNGIEADYDKDQTYWAFYVNGEMSMTGVDMTDIAKDAAYAFKVEK